MEDFGIIDGATSGALLMMLGWMLNRLMGKDGILQDGIAALHNVGDAVSEGCAKSEAHGLASAAHADRCLDTNLRMVRLTDAVSVGIGEIEGIGKRYGVDVSDSAARIRRALEQHGSE